ncbi:hypothetical protein [Aeromonas allosaccharophila]|uniref:hypothetical protein n=1 Tax=Aeromonas allosaccharophila TaxID=656 RepID=UPI001116E485|nr:hypothetical protein [Aeromonas allosaccharophila]TNI87762.1 hypothetical protein CF120_16880 [Aeromonas allosaccharophila]
MESVKVTKIILDAISDKLSKLSKYEFDSIANGSSKIEISIVRKEAKNKDLKNKDIKNNEKNISTKADMFYRIVSRLGDATSRDAGIIILEEMIPLKNDLELFAKYIDVVVNKSDRVESIKNKIVDATVGAKLRSGAIQGKEVGLFITSGSREGDGEIDVDDTAPKAD